MGNPEDDIENFRQAVQDTAYFLWEEAGRPDGRADEFWFQALDVHYRSRAYGIWMRDVHVEDESEVRSGGAGDQPAAPALTETGPADLDGEREPIQATPSNVTGRAKTPKDTIAGSANAEPRSATGEDAQSPGRAPRTPAQSRSMARQIEEERDA